MSYAGEWVKMLTQYCAPWRWRAWKWTEVVNIMKMEGRYTANVPLTEAAAAVQVKRPAWRGGNARVSVKLTFN